MKKNCSNCKFASPGFKLDTGIHHHCEEPTQYNEDAYNRGEFVGGWDTLRSYDDTCQFFEPKNKTRS